MGSSRTYNMSGSVIGFKSEFQAIWRGKVVVVIILVVWFAGSLPWVFELVNDYFACAIQVLSVVESINVNCYHRI